VFKNNEEVGHYCHGSGSYAGYSLYPAEGVCGLGSLTLTGVEQQIISGAFLCKAKHKLFVSDDENFQSRCWCVEQCRAVPN